MSATGRDTALLVGMCWALLISALAIPVMPSRIVSLCPEGYQREPGRGGFARMGRSGHLFNYLVVAQSFRYVHQSAAHEGHDFCLNGICLAGGETRNEVRGWRWRLGIVELDSSYPN